MFAASPLAGTGVVGLIAILLAAAPVGAQEQSRPPGPPLPFDVVVTSGEATIKHPPDLAFVTLAVEARERTPGDAQKKAADAMTAIQQRLREAGVGSDAVRTLNYELHPEFDYVDGRQRPRGYLARNTIEVRVDPVQRAGEVIGLGVQAGATSVGSPRFEVKERDRLERDALTRAVQNARARAEAAATGAGRSIERIVKVEDAGAAEMPPPRPIMMTARAEASQAAAPPIEPGEIEIRARVTLTARLR